MIKIGKPNICDPECTSCITAEGLLSFKFETLEKGRWYSQMQFAATEFDKKKDLKPKRVTSYVFGCYINVMLWISKTPLSVWKSKLLPSSGKSRSKMSYKEGSTCCVASCIKGIIEMIV